MKPSLQHTSTSTQPLPYPNITYTLPYPRLLPQTRMPVRIR